MLEAANQPMVTWRGGWSAEACADIKAFVEANGLPVTTAFRNQDLIDNRHPKFRWRPRHWREPAARQALKESDLIVAIGPRLGEATTRQLHAVRPAVPKQNWCMYNAPGARSSARLPGDAADHSGMAQFAAAARPMKPVDGSRWKANVEARAQTT